ncbi:MAG TPA: hypothetical protein VE992_06220 [Solirubrobacteraceae bacterium]|nr:hypothetical protein [Solirubrobacteraceae bacterium]
MVSEPTPSVIAYLDVIVLALAAPIMILMGVPALGYGVGAGAWVLLRAVGVLVERAAVSTPGARGQISMRMGYMLGRIFLLALAIILVRSSGGRDDGLAALVVIAAAFTIQLAISAVNRPRSR